MEPVLVRAPADGAATVQLPARSKDVELVRWIGFSLAGLLGLTAVGLAMRWVDGSPGNGSWRLPTLLLLVGAAFALVALGLVLAAPNPRSLTVDARGLTWQERSGRAWHVDWRAVPSAFSMGYAWHPFGNAVGPSPPVSYWLSHRRVRSIVITREAFEAIRSGARFQGLLEIETHPVSTQPTVSVVQIRFALGSSAR